MADLIYTTNVSLDGYIEDSDGRFDWGEPDEEVHSFIRELEAPAGTYLYGRRLYETMRSWETMEPDEAYTREFAEMWRAADKVVYSRSLDAVTTARTRLEHEFDANSVRRMKDAAARRLTIGGANLASQAFAAGLVDELRLLIRPVILGGGKPWLTGGMNLRLRLTDTRHFASGVVYLSYRPATA
ncbi:MAG: dihydrofolate reductase family protein [Candidatus Dormibacteraeota bacterium]|nr:dihydrofolate reductase family protein [Candidatus Dormibacteraeota bacterium]